MRGTQAMKVGRMVSRFSLMRVTPSVKTVKMSRNTGAQAICRPMTWARVSHRYCTSPGPRVTARAALVQPAMRLRWVSTTPLGFPVVPEV
jgi:hypothetical protein